MRRRHPRPQLTFREVRSVAQSPTARVAGAGIRTQICLLAKPFALLTCCCWLMSRSAVPVFSVFPPSPQRAFLADTQQISWQPDSPPQPQGSSGVLVNKTHTKTPSEITVQLGNWGSHCVRVWAGLSGRAWLAVPMLMPAPEAPVSGCVSTAADCSPPAPRQAPSWEVNQALFTCDVSHDSGSPERGSGVG